MASKNCTVTEVTGAGCEGPREKIIVRFFQYNYEVNKRTKMCFNRFSCISDIDNCVNKRTLMHKMSNV